MHRSRGRAGGSGRYSGGVSTERPEASPRHYPTMSTQVLKAMAHPVRRQLLAALGRTGSGRAADLATVLGEPANGLSFHLRVLAEAGLIEEAPELARDKRDRVWRPVPSSRTIGSPESPMADPVLGQAVLDGLVADHHALLDRVAAWAPRYTSGEDPVVRGTIEDFNLRVSRERLQELLGRIDALVDEYRSDETQEGERLIGWNLLLVAAGDEI